MAPARSNTKSVLMFVASLGTAALILNSQGSALNVEAAPLSRLLSFAPPMAPSLPSPTYPEVSETEEQQLYPVRMRPSLGRVRIRKLREHYRRIEPVEDEIPYLLHQQPDQQRMHPISVSHSTSPSQQQPQQQQQQRQQQQQQGVTGGWSRYSDDRTLEGHAVLDDDDDDAGNELLDTEADGLLQLVVEEEEIDDSMDEEIFEEDDTDLSKDIPSTNETGSSGGGGSGRRVVDVDDDRWRSAMIHKLSRVAVLTRKEALATDKTLRLETRA
ncbi:hypothetical protein BGX31_007610 [Mortierella sp. GBA43]|nr:hypothetical protein BGX31_007610 [Mortierella sp. GBA43]